MVRSRSRASKKYGTHTIHHSVSNKLQSTCQYNIGTDTHTHKETKRERERELVVGAIINPRDLEVRLFGRGIEVGNDIGTVLRRLETSKVHLGLGNVLFGVLEVLEQRLVTPEHTYTESLMSNAIRRGSVCASELHTSILVSLGVCKTLSITRGSANQTVQVGALLVGTTLQIITTTRTTTTTSERESARKEGS
jgi:hypothetical protein